MIARMVAPAPKAAVPPSNRQALLRLTSKPQMTRDTLNMSRRVPSKTFLMASPRSIVVRLSDSDENVKPEAARARGPVWGFY